MAVACGGIGRPESSCLAPSQPLLRIVWLLDCTTATVVFGFLSPICGRGLSCARCAIVHLAAIAATAATTTTAASATSVAAATLPAWTNLR